MITASSVYDRLGVLIAKATTLQTSFLNSPTGYGDGIENLSAHTWYGLTETLNQDVENAIQALVVAEKKIDAKF